MRWVAVGWENTFSWALSSRFRITGVLLPALSWTENLGWQSGDAYRFWGVFGRIGKKTGAEGNSWLMLLPSLADEDSCCYAYTDETSTETSALTVGCTDPLSDESKSRAFSALTICDQLVGAGLAITSSCFPWDSRKAILSLRSLPNTSTACSRRFKLSVMSLRALLSSLA